MALFGKKKALVGLDIGSSAVKLVELKKKGDGYDLATLAIEPLTQDTVVDGHIMDTEAVRMAIDKIYGDHSIKTNDVATSVSGHAVIVKRITVAAPTEADIAAQFEYDAPQYIPFDIKDVEKDFAPLAPAASGAGYDVMLVAVKRDKFSNHTGVLSRAGKTAAVVDIDAFAVQNAYEANYEPAGELTAALLNIGASIMNINITRAGNPLFTRDVSFGGNQYTDSLQKELNLTFDEAERLKLGQEVAGHTPTERTPLIASVSEMLVDEVHKTFDFFRQTTSPEPIQHIYLAGGTAKIEGLADMMKERFNVPVDVLNPFLRVNCNPAHFDRDYIEDIAPRMSVAVGLALRSFDAP